jgi:hypothetical protein
MAKILSTVGGSYVTINVAPGVIDASEGYALNISDGALGDTADLVQATADAVPVGIILTPLDDGGSYYGKATGQAVEVILGNALVEIVANDTETPANFTSVNYPVGTYIGFISGKYTDQTTYGSPEQTVSRRGVVVDNYTIGGVFKALIYVDKVIA